MVRGAMCIITNEFTEKHRHTANRSIIVLLRIPDLKPSQANFYHTYNIIRHLLYNMHVLEMTFETIFMQTFAQTRREFKFEYQSDEEEEVRKKKSHKIRAKSK